MVSQYDAYLYPFSERQVRIIQGSQLATSLLSVVVGTLGIALWIRMAPQRRIIFRLQLLISLILSDFLKALFLLAIGARKISTIPQLRANGDFDQGLCDAFGFLLSVVTFYSDLCMFCITVHNGLMILASSRTRPYRRRLSSFKYFFQSMWELVTFKRWFYKGFDSYGPNPPVVTQSEGGIFPYRFIILPAGIAIGLIIGGVTFIGPHNHFLNNNICSVPRAPIWKRMVNDWAFKYLNLLMIVVVYTAIIIYLHVHFKRIEKSKKSIYDLASPTLGDGSTRDVTKTLQRELMTIANDSTEKRRQAAWRETNAFVVYPIGYFLVWTTPTIIQIWNYAIDNKYALPYPVYLITAITIPLSCCVDTIIFMVREKPWAVTASRLRKRGSLFEESPENALGRTHSRANGDYDIEFFGGAPGDQFTRQDEDRDQEANSTADESSTGDGIINGSKFGVITNSRKHSQALSNTRTLVNADSRTATVGSYTYTPGMGLIQDQSDRSVVDDDDQEQGTEHEVMDLSDFLRMGP